ncbi:hypothetical protein BEH70_11730 [Citrobacter freundii]|nr:hypothetical protein BEH70_11730 [Citrobacter freundii]
MSNIDKHAQKELYAKVEQQAHSLRGSPREYQVLTGLCPVNVIEMQAQKIQALLDELEAEQRISSTWRKTAESNREKLEAAERRIAKLSASHGKLREAMAGIHNIIRGEGAYTPLAAILNASKRAYEESAAAAGKGE